MSIAAEAFAEDEFMDGSDIKSSLQQFSEYLTALGKQPVTIPLPGLIDDIVETFKTSCETEPELEAFAWAHSPDLRATLEDFVRTRECFHYVDGRLPAVEASFQPTQKPGDGLIVEINYTWNPPVLNFEGLQNVYVENRTFQLKPAVSRPCDRLDAQYDVDPNGPTMAWNPVKGQFEGHCQRSLASLVGARRLESFSMPLNMSAQVTVSLPGEMSFERTLRIAIPITVKRKPDTRLTDAELDESPMKRPAFSVRIPSTDTTPQSAVGYFASRNEDKENESPNYKEIGGTLKRKAKAAADKVSPPLKLNSLSLAQLWEATAPQPSATNVQCWALGVSQPSSPAQKRRFHRRETSSGTSPSSLRSDGFLRPRVALHHDCTYGMYGLDGESAVTGNNDNTTSYRQPVGHAAVEFSSDGGDSSGKHAHAERMGWEATFVDHERPEHKDMSTESSVRSTVNKGKGRIDIPVRLFEHMPVERKPVGHHLIVQHTIGHRPIEHRLSEHKPFGHSTIEHRPQEQKLVGHCAIEHEPIAQVPVECRATECEPSGSKPDGSNPAEYQDGRFRVSETGPGHNTFVRKKTTKPALVSHRPAGHKPVALAPLGSNIVRHRASEIEVNEMVETMPWHDCEDEENDDVASDDTFPLRVDSPIGFSQASDLWDLADLNETIDKLEKRRHILEGCLTKAAREQAEAAASEARLANWRREPERLGETEIDRLQWEIQMNHEFEEERKNGKRPVRKDSMKRRG